MHAVNKRVWGAATERPSHSLLQNNFRCALGVQSISAVGEVDDGAHGLAVGVEGVDAHESLLGDVVADALIALA